MKIKDANESHYAKVDEDCSLVIQDLTWLKALCLNVGAVGDADLRIIDKNTKEVFKVSFVGVKND